MASSAGPLFVSAAVDSGVAWTPEQPVAGNAAGWNCVGETGLGSRWFHTMFVDPVGQQLVMSGGYNVPQVMVRPLSGPRGWTPLEGGSGSGPGVRYFGAYALDPRRDALLMYGGQDASGALLADLWELPLTPGGQVHPISVQGVRPGALRNAAFMYDAARERFLLIGGDNLDSQLFDAWELRLEPVPVWRQLPVSGTVPAYQVLYADARRGDAWSVTYGLDRVHHVSLGDDSIVYEDVTTTGAGPADSYYAVLAGFDPVQRRILWFHDSNRSGGLSVPMNQLWTTALGEGIADWQLRNVPGPWPVSRGCMPLAFDPTSSQVLLDGGVMDNGIYFADTWGLRLPVDLPTATVASLVEAASAASGVLLRWSVDATEGTPCIVERSGDGVAWTVAGSAQWTGAHEIRFADAPLAAGERVAYHLRIAAGVGATIWLGAPATGVALAITPVSNPCRGTPSLRLSLAGSAPGRLRLLDVSGRVVGEATVPAGTRQWTSGAPVPPGLYFAEVVQSGARRSTRIVVTP
jgi:hypothetical protein